MDRKDLIAEIFPEGIPRLWCPVVTHFSAPGVVDRERTRAQLASIAGPARGLLAPGSTGEGWGMTDAEFLATLDAVLAAAAPNGQKLLVGILKPDSEAMRAGLDRVTDYLKARAGTADLGVALRLNGVAGITLCPPSGAALTQEHIAAELASMLRLGLPTALYQLPQVTGNEMSPETVAALTGEFPNFILFKDTSGGDAVASSGAVPGDVFLVRGAEGAYARWPKSAGGPYDGFLLSTANAFAAELDRMLRLLDSGRRAEAEDLAAALDGAVAELFALVGGFPAGNPFAVANKLLDHLRAWGPEAESRPMPILRGGERLPKTWVASARAILERHGVAFGTPYLA